MNTLRRLANGLQFHSFRTPSRDDLARLRPVTRLTLLVLLGWCALASAATLSAVVVIESAAWGSAGPVARTPGTGLGTGRAGSGEAMLQRPLFVRSRQQAVVVAAPVLPQSPPPPPPVVRDASIGLKGVFINDKMAKAFLTTAQNPVGVWLAPEESVGGWRLVAVRPDEVELEGGGQRMVVPFAPAGGQRMMVPFATPGGRR